MRIGRIQEALEPPTSQENPFVSPAPFQDQENSTQPTLQLASGRVSAGTVEGKGRRLRLLECPLCARSLSRHPCP